MVSPAEPEPRGWSEVGRTWLVRWRWAVALGAAGGGIFAAWTGEGTATVIALAAVAVLVVGSNLWVSRRLVGATALGGVLAFDTIALTLVLGVSGGPSNPFSILYMMQVTLAAVVLGRRWTAALVALSITAYGALFALAGSPGQAMHHGHEAGFSSHLQGMFVAFAVTASAIAFLVTRIAGALQQRELELIEARQVAAQVEHVAALTTLAAGAAHELGTPLGTIAIAARELEREAAQLEDPTFLEDATLIREEAARCRRILDQMHEAAAAEGGEAVASTEVRELVAEVQEALPTERRGRLHVEVASDVDRAEVPPQRFVTALLDLIDNAFDAQPEGEVTLQVRRTDAGVRFEVRDRGPGMAPDVLRRARDPFFTTKEAGLGMGLGLFLAQALADRIGGRLDLECHPDRGTIASLEVPT